MFWWEARILSTDRERFIKSLELIRICLRPKDRVKCLEIAFTYQLIHNNDSSCLSKPCSLILPDIHSKSCYYYILGFSFWFCFQNQITSPSEHFATY